MELFLTYQEWRIIQIATIVYSTYHILGTARDVYARRQRRKAEAENKKNQEQEAQESR